MTEQYTIKPALVLDLDGTVRRSKKGQAALLDPLCDAGPCVDPGDVELFPGVEEFIHAYKAAHDCYVVAVSNQGWVAKGSSTMAQILEVAVATRNAFASDPFDILFACPFDTKGTVAPHNLRSLTRKPDYGMLVLAEHYAHTAAGVYIDWDHPATVMVGDRADDHGCASIAGVHFEWACDFFGRQAPYGAASRKEDITRWRVLVLDANLHPTYYHFPNDTTTIDFATKSETSGLRTLVLSPGATSARDTHQDAPTGKRCGTCGAAPGQLHDADTHETAGDYEK